MKMNGKPNKIKEIKMGDQVSFLITLCSGNYLVRCGLKVKTNQISSKTIEFYNETKSREELYELLPEHVKSFGKIVDVERIFDIEIKGE